MTATTAPAAQTVVPAAGRSRRLLVPLATLVAATGIALASGATFSSSTASSGLVASGTLSQLNSSTVAFSQDKLVPGDTVTGSVTITNTGDVPALFTLTESPAAAAGGTLFDPMSDLTLEIKDDAGTVVSETKTLGTAGQIELGVFEADDARTYTYTVTFDEAAGNEQQGKTAATRYVFSSISVPQDYVGSNNSVSSTTEIAAP